MSAQDLDPYSPPSAVDERDESQPGVRWQVVPALFFLVLGSLSLLILFFGIGVAAFALLTGEFAEAQRGASAYSTNISIEVVIVSLLAFVMYLGLGLSWVWAGTRFWKKRYRSAIIGVLVGLLFPLAAFTIGTFFWSHISP